MNSVNIIGRLGRDVETRYTGSGTQVANFSVAVDEVRKEEKVTHWFNVVAWAKTAEFAGQYLQKGQQVGVTGRLQTRKWEKDGKEHQVVEIVAERITLVGPKPDKAAKPKQEVADEDIPF